MEFKVALILSLGLSAAAVQTPGCSVTAKVGETVILPVNHSLPEDSELLQPIINWKNERGGIVHDYWYVHDNNEYQDERFKGRTSLFSREEIVKGNVSLKISNITKNDEGRYTCEVHIDGEMIYSVFLCVKEKEKHREPPENPEPEQPGLTTGQTAGIVIGVLNVLAAIIGVTVFLSKKLKKDLKGIYRDV